MSRAEDVRRRALEAEIREHLGLVPAFFRIAASAEIAERLWSHARSAYLGCPIPRVFKEELFAYLSRFCAVPYCMVHHAAFLRGFGSPPAEDSEEVPRTPEDVLRLLRQPIPQDDELEHHLKLLAGRREPIEAWPADASSELGGALLACAVQVFLRRGAQQRCLLELRRVLGPEKLEQLNGLLGFIRTAHEWVEAHPGPEFEREVEELLQEHPELNSWVERYRAVVESELRALVRADLGPFELEHEALQRSTSHLGAILEDSLNEIYVFDAKTLRFIQVNQGARKNLGYSIEELRKLTPVDLKPQYSAASFRELLAPLQSGDRSRLEFTTVHRRKDGSEYPVEAHVQLSSVAGSRAYVAIIVDITERLAQEEQIAKLEARAQAVLGAAPDAILTINESGVIEGMNAATTRLLGWEESELIGQNVKILMPPPYAEEHDGYLERYLRTGDARIIGKGREVEARHKDGTVFPILLSVGVARFDHRRLFTGIIHDLRARRQVEAEARDLQAQLLQSQKMEAIGTLAGGIAHDFNNLLTSILGSTEILIDHLEPGSRLARSAGRIRRAADRATGLTNRLLGLSRKQVTRRAPIDLNETVEETRELFQGMLPEDVALTTRSGDGPLFVRADEGQLGQVLMNLVVNAGDAMSSGDRIEITTERVVLHGPRAAALDLSPGEFAAVTVRDSGEGMLPETVAKIFDPFFTTKEEGRGTGLGLSTSLRIIREHDGAIEVESEPGIGTTFTVLLPEIAAPVVARVDDDVCTPRGPGAGETVLLVEDDEIMRDLLGEVLGEEGYQVVSASEPQEALRRATEHDVEVDLVITDVVMPTMSGFDLSKELRAAHPKLRVLFMSGYTGQVLADRGKLSDDDPFIRKPFSNDALLARVREVLDGRPVGGV